MNKAPKKTDTPKEGPKNDDKTVEVKDAAKQETEEILDSRKKH